MDYNLNTIFSIMFASAMGTLLFDSLKKASKDFTFADKIRAVTFLCAFALGVFCQALQNNIIACIGFITGLVLSEFNFAVVFYEKYKDMEIPHE